MKRLTRSPSNRMVTGVCGGMAEYFGVSADIVRLLWLTSVVLGGIGVPPYVAAVLLLPQGEGARAPAAPVPRIVGFALLGLGILFLLRTFGTRVLDPTVLAFWKLRALGPVLLLVAGGLLVWPGSREYLRPAGRRPKRSLSDRVLAGVAGGLARELAIDPNLLRLAFVAGASLTFGLAVLLYLLLAFVLPEESPEGASGSGPLPPGTVPPASSRPGAVNTGSGDQATSGEGR